MNEENKKERGMAGEYWDIASFPSDWPLHSIGEFADVKGGKRLPAGATLVPHRTSHPYLRIVDFKDRRIDKSALLYVPEEVFPRIARYTISSKDIYISIVGTIGLVGVIDDDLDGANLTENAAKICNIASNIDRDYLAAFLRSDWGQHQIRSLTVGSTQPKLALFRIANIRVPVPPLPEQRAIAHILGTLDDKIELNRRMSETLEAMARALFKSWFVDFDPVRAKMDGRWQRGQSLPGLPAHLYDLFPDRLVDSELGEIPEGWEVGTVGQLAEVSSGKRPDVRFSEPSEDAPVPLWGGNGPMAFVREALFDEPILITGRVGTLGSVFRVTTPCWPSDNTLVVRAKQHAVFEYLFLQLRQVDFASLNRGSTQPLLTQTDLKAQLLLLPKPNVLKCFSHFVGSLYLRIDEFEGESRTLAALRDTLLPKLISGALRVKNAERFLKERGL